MRIHTKQVASPSYYDLQLVGHNAPCHGKQVDREDGTIHWLRDGIRHNPEGPATFYPTGMILWVQHGQYHREGGPAVIYEDGSKDWFYEDREVL